MVRPQVPPTAISIRTPCARRCQNSATSTHCWPISKQSCPTSGIALWRASFWAEGTPSLCSPEAMARLLEGCARVLRFAADIEVTLEANPGTIERGRFGATARRALRASRWARRVFPMRSCSCSVAFMQADDTRRAAEELHAAGLSNFNLDLMYGLRDRPRRRPAPISMPRWRWHPPMCRTIS